MPSSNGEVDGDGEEGVDIVDVVGAKGINIVFSFTLCNNFKLVDLDLEFGIFTSSQICTCSPLKVIVHC